MRYNSNNLAEQLKNELASKLQIVAESILLAAAESSGSPCIAIIVPKHLQEELKNLINTSMAINDELFESFYVGSEERFSVFLNAEMLAALLYSGERYSELDTVRDQLPVLVTDKQAKLYELEEKEYRLEDTGMIVRQSIKPTLSQNQLTTFFDTLIKSVKALPNKRQWVVNNPCLSCLLFFIPFAFNATHNKARNTLVKELQAIKQGAKKGSVEVAKQAAATVLHDYYGALTAKGKKEGRYLAQLKRQLDIGKQNSVNIDTLNKAIETKALAC